MSHLGLSPRQSTLVSINSKTPEFLLFSAEAQHEILFSVKVKHGCGVTLSKAAFGKQASQTQPLLPQENSSPFA